MLHYNSMVIVLIVELKSHSNIVDETTANKYSECGLILKLIYPDLGHKPRP